MNTVDILHEIKNILTVYHGIGDNRSEKARELKEKVAERAVKVIEEIVSNPSNICLLECPYKKSN